ncbi:autotransporter outer membrane beta-barrel domain-containing protein [Syntrophus aciditrophicus]|uniref:Outer membrane protein n=1 Tax=Syntrophus aciditrophicus (strain SB) TaxID=56780 RepID=Q2LTD1_SYNAS|nr:autotransporter outer membrane beta-barrel domain-containing protein [Syntrophus aciditrophicus]ABC77343.1 outer membrane protein [Syntrophus aciditrophicus SB]
MYRSSLTCCGKFVLSCLFFVFLPCTALSVDYVIPGSPPPAGFSNLFAGDTLTINSGGDFTNTGTNWIYNNGIITNNAGGTFTNNNGNTRNDTTFINSGTFTNANVSQIYNYGTFTNNTSGTLTNDNSYIHNMLGAVITNDGTFTNLNSNTSTIREFRNYGTFTNNGSFTNSNSRIYNAASGVITNNGTFINEAGSTIENNGAFANQPGAVLINDGTFTANTPFTNSGTLSGIGTINGNVTNAGTLAPGNSIGQMTITGNYTHNAGAAYQVDVNAAGQSDRLVVTGTATLNGGAVDVLAQSGSYLQNTSYTILTAGGGVTGVFGTVTSNLAFLTPSLSYDPSNVYLLLTRNSTNFVDVAGTPNQRAVASAFDSISPGATGEMEAVLNSLTSLSADGARSAFDQMGGNVHTALTGVSFSSFNSYMGVLTGRMGGGIADRSFLASLPQPMYASRGDVATDAGGNLSGGDEWGIWARVYGNVGDRDGNDVTTEYDYNMGGLAIGFDRKITNILLLGFSVGLSGGKLDMNDLTESSKINSWHGSLYGSCTKGAWYMDGILAYGYNRYDTSRDISFGAVDKTADAEYDGHIVGAYMEAGYKLKLNTINITPMASFQASHLTRDDFTEDNAGVLSLDGDSENADSLLGTLGIKVNRDFVVNAATITPEVRIKWLHEFSNDDYMLDTAFAGAPAAPFTIRGDHPDRDRVAFGVGLNADMKNNSSLFLAYDANFSGEYTEHVGSLGWRYRW